MVAVGIVAVVVRAGKTKDGHYQQRRKRNRVNSLILTTHGIVRERWKVQQRNLKMVQQGVHLV